MSDEDSDTPCVSIFSKRAKLAPKKTPEELKAAEELVKKIEVEKKVQMDEAIGIEAESFGNKAGSSGKKGQKKKAPPRVVESSQAHASSLLESSQPCKCTHSPASSHRGSSQPCKHSDSPASSAAINDKILDRELEETVLSAAAKKRIKKVKDEQKFDLMLIDAKNAMILKSNPFKRSDVIEEVPTVEEEKIFHVTVNYLSKVARFKCLEGAGHWRKISRSAHIVDRSYPPYKLSENRVSLIAVKSKRSYRLSVDKIYEPVGTNEKFFKVFKDVGDFFNLKPSEFLLCLNDRNIAASDTPKSLCLSDIDILDCIPYKPALPSTSAFDEDSLTVTFQSNDSKSKIDLVVNRMEKMKVVMEQYAKKRKIPLNELKFEFDGEKLSGTETPADLDMDSGDCIDVRVFTPMPQCSRASDDQRSDDKQSAKDDYFSFYFQDFTFVDSDSNDSDVIALD